MAPPWLRLSPSAFPWTVVGKGAAAFARADIGPWCVMILPSHDHKVFTVSFQACQECQANPLMSMRKEFPSAEDARRVAENAVTCLLQDMANKVGMLLLQEAA